MKVLMKEIDDIIASFHKGKSSPTPWRFRIPDENGEIVTIKVRVITVDEEKYAGNKMFVYKCQSIINEVEGVLELKYEVNTCKWFLFKM